jgi:SAM-dependent methyltransferase
MASVPGLVKQFLPDPVYRYACRQFDRMRDAAFMAKSLGGELQCPFCRLRFKRFVPIPGAASPLFEEEHVVGGGPFQNGDCPWCGSFERERHVYLYLRDETDVLSRSLRLMHVAPERSVERVLRRAKQIDYLTVDLDASKADLKCDLTDIPLESNSFDVILCNHVLEHIPDDRAAMRELARVLKPNGWAMLQVPLAVTRAETREDPAVNTEQLRLLHYGQRDHVRIYGRDYADRLASVGFAVERHDTRVVRGNDYVHRYALIPDELLYIVRKNV